MKNDKGILSPKKAVLSNSEKDSPEWGGALLGVIIASTIVSLAVAAYLMSTSNLAKSSKMNKSQQQFEDVIQALSNTIVSRFNSGSPDYCSPSTYNVTFADVPFGGAKLNYFQSALPIPPGSVPTGLQASMDRCRQIAAPPSRDYFHFCMKVEPDLNSPSNTFLGAEFAFIELSIIPIRSIDNQRLSCPGGSDSIDSLKVFYRAYWGEPIGNQNGANKYMFWNRGGFFFASPNVT